MNSTAINPTPPSTLRRVVVETAAYYRAERAPEGSGRAPILIGLHGYGQTAEGFLGVMRKLAPPDFAAAAGQGVNQIWDPATKQIAFSWLTSFEKQDSIDRNNRYLETMIDELAADGVADPSAVFILGFSQGSSVAFRFAQRHPRRVRGLISACADLPPDVEADLAPLRDIPVMVAYGLQDRIIPQGKSIHAADALRSFGIDTEVVTFDRGHLIPSSIAPRVETWTRAALARKEWPTPAVSHR